MRKYIMFCYGYGVGGGQNYVNGKVKYLKEHGWSVYVFPVKEKKNPGHIVWQYLSEYEKYSSPAFSYSPFFWPKGYRNKVLKKMVETVGKEAEEIIIESHNEPFSVWGELLAEELGAKHFAFILEEQFDNYSQFDFFSFKFDRDELAGIHKKSIPMLLKNIRNVPEDEHYHLSALRSLNGVVDYFEPKVEDVKKLDWNIGYIGRSKQYSETVVNEVIRFASCHLDKKINFCILGELRGDWENKIPSNMIVTKLGFLVPMPRKFFEKLDVAIAGAGCARYAATEGVETIIVDANNARSNGVLGYTCFDTLYASGTQEDISDTLEKVLIDKVNKGKKFSLNVKSAADQEQCFEKHLLRIEASSEEKDYYNFQTNYPLISRCRTLLRFGVRWFFPKLYDMLMSHGVK